MEHLPPTVYIPAFICGIAGLGSSLYAMILSLKEVSSRAKVSGKKFGTDDEAAYRKFGERFRIIPREMEVVKLIAEGKSTSDIAESLFISDATVRMHTGNIFRKAGVKNRPGLLKALSWRRD